jgi:Lantibiotic dehydratase, N terminus
VSATTQARVNTLANGQQTWHLGEWSMARVGGLPIDAVGGLRCPRSAQWAEEVLEAETRLSDRATIIADGLHDLIRDNDDQDARRMLLELRRQLFNNKLPSLSGDVLTYLREHRPDLAEETEAWIAIRTSYLAHLGTGAALVKDELVAARRRLREIVRDDRLRAGLLLASPTLAGQLPVFAGSSGEKPAKKERKIERSVLGYLYRTACKTSPFSTFTGVRLGRLGAGGQGPGDVVQLDGKWTSHVRINVVALSRISAQILARPDRRADVPVTVASGWEREEDRIRYVRRWVHSGDDSAKVTFDSVTDRLFFLRTSAMLDRLLEHVEQHPGVRFAEVSTWLGEQADASADDCARYLSALLEVGILHVPSMSTDVHTEDPLRAYQSMLRSIEREWADELAELLESPALALAAYPNADADDRIALLRDFRAGLASVLERLGVPDPVMPQTVVYEDVVEQHDPIQWDRARWEDKLRDPLQSLQHVLPAFDLTLPQRITFKGFFVARFGVGGSCDDVLALFHDFHEDFFDQYVNITGMKASFDEAGQYVPEENWLGLPELGHLDDARRTFIEGVRERFAAHPQAEELVIDEALVEQVAQCLSDVRAGDEPQAHFMQVAGRGKDARLVLNQSYGGLSFPFSRFAYCLDDVADGSDLADVLRTRSRERLGPGRIFAEVTGGIVMSNLNLHGRLTDYEIVCPGEISTVPPERRIDLDDLFVLHDAEADRLVLRSRRLDVEVVPVYLGYLVPLALPEIPRALLLLSPTSMAPVDPWAGVPEAEPRDGVQYRPRVSLAGIVLRRRAWRTTARDLPLTDASADDHTRLLAWCRWRRHHGLPVSAFARVAEPPDGTHRPGVAKPQYVDFESLLSLIALEGLIKSTDATVVFAEMLPSAEQLVARSADGEHVTEFAIETYNRPVPDQPAPSGHPHQPAYQEAP